MKRKLKSLELKERSGKWKLKSVELEERTGETEDPHYVSVVLRNSIYPYSHKSAFSFKTQFNTDVYISKGLITGLITN